jgi:hypothetical protein
MTARILIALSLVLGLSACSDGLSLNPLNWFGSRGPTNVALTPEGGYPESRDFRIPVQQVTALRVEKTTAGVIVYVTGLPPRAGYWDAELVPENDGEPVNGVMSYVFRIAEPRWNQPAGTPYSRTVHVARFISNAKLRDVTSIRVTGATNSMTGRR